MTIYSLTSPKIDGEIELQYTNGVLNCITMAFKQPLNAIQFKALVSSVKQFEADLPQLEGLGLIITAAMPANQKIALFCSRYEFHKKRKYQVTPAESGKFKQSKVKITAEILDAYFLSENFLFKGKHGMGNLIKYYNQLLDEIATGPISKHPDHWSKTYEDKLDDEGRVEYWAHLRGLGLRPVRDRVQRVTDWIKAVE